MAASRKAEQIRSYEEVRPQYVALSASLQNLIESLLRSEGIRFHLVESRAKTTESFSEKISRPGKRYKSPLSDMTDLCGVRVICNFHDDIAKVIDILRTEFVVKEEQFSNSRESLESFRFGYLSYHLICQISERRYELPEWRQFKNLNVEIQVRTVVQHAWSAVSHIVNYKQDSDVPSALQRKLNRLAGLFELVDEQFVEIRNERLNNQLQAKNSIASGDKTIKISAYSVKEFLAASDVKKLLVDNATEAGFDIYEEGENPYNFTDDETDEDSISHLSSISHRLGLKSVSDLEIALKSANLSIFERLINDDDGDSWSASPAFLAILALIDVYKKAIKKEDLTSNGFHESIADRVIKAAKAA